LKPLITALVDTYNHEKYIEQALVGALEQGLPEVEPEIVVVDDGSTDKTVCDRSEVRAAGEACAEKEWRRFYEMRNWYARRQLGRYREWVSREGLTG